MLHLPAERLAALADESPSALEADHLALCASCSAEVAAQRRLLALAGDERLRIAPAITNWESLSAELRSEGLLAGEDRDARDASRRATRWGLRAAAAVMLVAGGSMLGRYSAGASVLPGGSYVAASPSGAPEGLGTAVADTMRVFGSTSDALATMAAAEREYQRAAAFLATHDSTAQSEGASDVYRTRLAALDDISERSRQALYEAPQDPVMNQVYLSTLGAREATLRQLGTALPTGARLTRF